MAFVEPFARFFNVAEFADTGLLDGVDVNGIFDAMYVDVLDVESSGPIFTLATDDTNGVAHGSVLVITSGRGVGVWTIRGVQPDGTGVTLLRLEKQ